MPTASSVAAVIRPRRRQDACRGTVGVGQHARKAPVLLGDLLDDDVDVLRLVEAGVEYQIRETFESALVFGHAVLVGLGVEDDEAAETMQDVRRRDGERLEMQIIGGIKAGRALIRGNMVTPEPAPLTAPQRKGKALNPDAAAAIGEDGRQETADAR